MGIYPPVSLNVAIENPLYMEGRAGKIMFNSGFPLAGLIASTISNRFV